MRHIGESFFVPEAYQGLLRDVGLMRPEQFFTHPRIVPWRSIPERENCTLDATLADGRTIRLHIKRHKAMRGISAARREAEAIDLLERANIPTTALVAWGSLEDGRSFIATEDLAGFKAADKLIESGVTFDRLLKPTADLAARLHDARLHHRDLYLCHFFAKLEENNVELRLIDPGRVRRLPWLFRQRWITKDLAQFWYSGTRLSIAESKLDQWLARYAGERKLDDVHGLRRSILKKSDWIARHDAKLQIRQPDRNVSLPEARRV